MNWLTYHTEVPVNQAFASGPRIDWLKPGVDPNTPTKPRPTEFPEHWIGNPGQPIIGTPYKESKHSPWLYGERPDLQRLIGNATPGYGS